MCIYTLAAVQPDFVAEGGECANYQLDELECCAFTTMIALEGLDKSLERTSKGLRNYSISVYKQLAITVTSSRKPDKGYLHFRAVSGFVRGGEECPL